MSLFQLSPILVQIYNYRGDYITPPMMLSLWTRQQLVCAVFILSHTILNYLNMILEISSTNHVSELKGYQGKPANQQLILWIQYFGWIFWVSNMK